MTHHKRNAKTSVPQKGSSSPVSKKRGAMGKVVGGALIAGGLAVAAGLFLASKQGQKFRKGIKARYSDFYKQMAPKLKKLKSMSEREYQAYMKSAVQAYARAKKLTAAESDELMGYADTVWKAVKKHI